MAKAQDYSNDKKWVNRIEDGFDQIESVDGYATRENVSVTKVLKDLPQDITRDRPEQVAKAREIAKEVLDTIGLVEGMKADKVKYIELFAIFAAAEANRKAKGEVTFLEKYNNALFDILDTNSNGFLSFNEYKVLTRSSGLDDDAARAAFNVLDKDGSGRLDKREFAAAVIKFWCQLDSSGSEGLFGPKIR